MWDPPAGRGRSVTAPTIAGALTVPEGAIPTPPGWCACCGAVDPDRLCSVDGPGALQPRDPSDVVWYAARQGLRQIGINEGDDALTPAMAARIRARLDTMLRTWTAQ